MERLLDGIKSPDKRLSWPLVLPGSAMVLSCGETSCPGVWEIGVDAISWRTSKDGCLDVPDTDLKKGTWPRAGKKAFLGGSGFVFLEHQGCQNSWSRWVNGLGQARVT